MTIKHHLRTILEILYSNRDGVGVYQLRGYYTITEIETFLNNTIHVIDLPQLVKVLQIGAKRGVYKKCVTPDTQYDSSPEFMYSYNKNLFVNNPKNIELFKSDQICTGIPTCLVVPYINQVGNNGFPSNDCRNRSGSGYGK
jgi:hypothetical protein